MLPLILNLAVTFAKVGMFTFGSGYAMLALLQQEVLHRRAWLTPQEFADIVSVAEVTPGPIMVNIATFVGYKVAGLPGVLAANAGLITPPIMAILLLTMVYLRYSDQRWLRAALSGLRPVVVALILVAVVRLAQASFPGGSSWRLVLTAALFTAAFAAVYLRWASPIWAALAGIAVGLLFFR